jgi:hypothetical protein
MNEADADRKAENLARQLFGSMSPFVSNPLVQKRPLPSGYRLTIHAELLDGSPIVGYSVGVGGHESVTDSQGNAVVEVKE